MVPTPSQEAYALSVRKGYGKLKVNELYAVVPLPPAEFSAFVRSTESVLADTLSAADPSGKQTIKSPTWVAGWYAPFHKRVLMAISNPQRANAATRELVDSSFSQVKRFSETKDKSGPSAYRRLLKLLADEWEPKGFNRSIDKLHDFGVPNGTPYSKFVTKFKALATSELASHRAFAPDLRMVQRALRDALLEQYPNVLSSLPLKDKILHNVVFSDKDELWDALSSEEALKHSPACNGDRYFTTVTSGFSSAPTRAMTTTVGQQRPPPPSPLQPSAWSPGPQFPDVVMAIDPVPSDNTCPFEQDYDCWPLRGHYGFVYSVVAVDKTSGVSRTLAPISTPPGGMASPSATVSAAPGGLVDHAEAQGPSGQPQARHGGSTGSPLFPASPRNSQSGPPSGGTQIVQPVAVAISLDDISSGKEYYNDEVFLFWKPPSFLSIWTPCEFSVHGIRYVCGEQFMMAEKARIFGDDAACAKIMATSDPREHKSLGRKVRRYDHALWELRREDIVFSLLYAKFAQNADARERLLAKSDRQIAEASPYDGLWGIGVDAFDPRAASPAKWTGKHLLGKALVATRTLLRVRPVEPDKPFPPEHSGQSAPVCPTIHEIAPPGEDPSADDPPSEDARGPLGVPANTPSDHSKQVLHIASAAFRKAAASPPPLLAEHGPDLADGSVRPILFVSRATLESERNWTVLDLEAGSIVWAIKRLHDYFWSTHFLIYSDHKILESIVMVGEHNARVQRWL
ncbi:unnamed protein product [Ectocarpus sp. CCAP 1310/34]|nr:unnamed protein product [Ectocarpus sp. CCAP 1310/34]